MEYDLGHRNHLDSAVTECDRHKILLLLFRISKNIYIFAPIERSVYVYRF